MRAMAQRRGRKPVAARAFAWPLLAALAGLAAAPPAAADVSADVRTLAWRRPVVLPEGAAAGWYAVVEDSLLAAACRPELTDLRLTDAEGRSLPVLAEPPSKDHFRWTTLREQPAVWTAGERGAREIVVDLGSDVPPRLTVELTGVSAQAPVQLTGRDSAADEWVLLPVIDGNGRAANAPAPPGASRRVQIGAPRRFLRVTQQGGSAPGADDRLLLLTRDSLAPALEPLEIDASGGRFTGFSRNDWREEVRLRGPARAVAELDLRWTDPHLAPSWRVDARLPRGGWRTVSAGGAAPDSIALEPVRTTALRVTVSGADAPNAPCEVLGVKAAHQRWLFRIERPESLWVSYGDRYLEAPAAAGEAPPRDALVREASLGAPEANPFRREPAFGLDWLERRPGVVGGVMVVLLGLVTWLAVGRSGAPRPES